MAVGDMAEDADVAFADLQRFLSRRVAAHFGRRREDAQELESQLEALVVENELEDPRFLVQLDFGRNLRIGVKACHDYLCVLANALS